MGARGLIGSALSKKIRKDYFKEYKLINLNRYNYKKYFYSKCDIFINANGNSSKHIANIDPFFDFNRSVQTTYETVKKFIYGQYIFISSTQVYEKCLNSSENNKIKANKNNVYGFNKLLSESIIRFYCNNYIILRAGPIVSKKLKKNYIFDILANKKVYVNPKNQSTFLNIKNLIFIILKLIKLKKKNEIYNVCGKNPLSFYEISNILKKKPNFYLKKKKIFNNKVNINKIQKIFKKISFDTKKNITDEFNI